MTQYAVGLPNVGEFGDPRVLVDLAEAAESAGWDAVYLWDHLLYHDPEWMVANPVVALSAIAARTTRVRLGVLMTALPRRRPQVVAREAATLDVLCGGRSVFGAALGSMDSEYAAFGEDPSLRSRARLLDSSLTLIDSLWSGTGPVVMEPKPLQQPRIPIWCAGRWPTRAGFRRAARWDGVVAIFDGYGREKAVPPALLAEAVDFIRAERGSLDGFDVAVEGWTSAVTAAGTVAQYAAAGLTWWIEAMGWWRGGVAEAMERIGEGPPR